MPTLTWNPENITQRERPPVRSTWAPVLEVRYLGPTNTLGSRVKASWLDGNRDTVTLGLNNAMSVSENEDAAAQTLVQRRLDTMEATTGSMPGLRYRLVRGMTSVNSPVLYFTEAY